MTSIDRKLTAAIASIALLAPAAGAQAATGLTRQHARRFTTSSAERHLSTNHARRHFLNVRRDGRAWN